jgi:hypothetical protein
MTRIELPVQLPDGWSVEADESFGVVITGILNGHSGFVTVNEQRRGFALGMCRVANTPTLYSGRYWRKELYEAAIASLREALT